MDSKINNIVKKYLLCKIIFPASNQNPARRIYFVIFTYFSAMFIKKALLFILVIGCCYAHCYSQQGDFCNAITTIIRDAPNRFRNIRGKLIEANASTTLWESGVTVPGTIGSRFVYAMGLFYEGAFFQSKNKDELKAAYDKYKGILNDCLAPQGYIMTQNDNLYHGLSDYKKVVFMLDEKDEITQDVKDKTKPLSPPAHITMEANYSKDVDKYTIVMYIFEH
jgi:hypothetical protein